MTREHLHVGRSDEGSSDASRQKSSSQPIPSIMVLGPRLPAGLEHISTSEKAVVPEQGGDGFEVKVSAVGTQLVHVSRQVGQFAPVDEGSQAKCGEQPRRTIMLDDGHVLHNGCENVKRLGQLEHRRPTWEEASLCGDGEGVGRCRKCGRIRV